MAGRAYYNEVDSYAAQWICNLAEAGHIAPGHIDTRSVVDVRPADLAGCTQFHTFAGIAGWSLALRLAGVPDDLSVWTGSCPCQPFSAAGRRGGLSDDRHLWPAWFDLIRACRPTLVFGEQVASADGLGWLDAVFADLEGEGYACRAADLCAAGAGAPHIRQRLWFVAYADGGQHCRMFARPDGLRKPGGSSEGASGEPDAAARTAGSGGASGGVGDASCIELPKHRPGGIRPEETAGAAGLGRDHRVAGASQDGGFWSAVEWLPCRDPERGVVHRPVEPGSFPLAHGLPARVGKLRAYGNAIVPQVAAAFIGAVIDTLSSSGPIPHGKRDGGSRP